MPTRPTTGEESLPRRWFNFLPHLPERLPPVRDPDDGRASRVEVMRSIRVPALTAQDSVEEPWVAIPDEVLERYAEIGRPTRLLRARELEKYLDTPARIYFKREDTLPTASFKLNSAIAQAYYAKKAGADGLVTETGAGQWGVAVAYACNMYRLENVIFWVRISAEQKGARVALAKLYGATVHTSPSSLTASGRKILEADPNCYGSLGTSIGDAISFAMEHPGHKYVSGSNLPHVLLHQTVIGLETRQQLEALGEEPDELVACVGGGSNLGGFMLPFLPDKRAGKRPLRLLAAESDAAPRLTRGEYRYDHSDPVGLTPLTLSYTLGMNYMPPPVHMGGLRQHNGSAVVGLLRKHELLDAVAYSQEEAFRAGQVFIQRERIVAAPESCHAIKAVIDSALEAKRRNERRVIVACLSGNGLLDMNGYTSVLGV
jgi:tryptophan synthase beta chain